MRKEVTIQQSKDGIITAGCDKGACEGCKGSFFCTSKNTVFEVLNPENIELKAGDKAEIDMPPSKTLFSIFMSLGLPLILFIPGYFIASLFSSSDGIRLIGALIGIASGFAVAAIYFRAHKREYTPRVTRKV